MTYPINHIHLKSQDPRKAAEWYEKYFGARVLEELDTLPGVKTIRMAMAGDTRLFISNVPKGKAVPKGSAETHLGLEHFGFDVPDLPRELERLQKAGVKIRLPLTVIPDGMKLAFIEAPDDVLIELVEAK